MPAAEVVGELGEKLEAWNDVATVDGIPEKDVTGRTNILVIGNLNPAILIPEPPPRARPPTPSPCRARGRTSRS
jgi:hypothetical protein